MSNIQELDYEEDFDDWEDTPIKCNVCFGTGLDRYVDADCMNCAGDGYV